MRNWAVVIIVVLFILLWTAVIYHAVGDRPRTWDYGTTPYIPAQSYYSSQPQPTGQPAPPRQIPPVTPPPGSAP